MGTSGNTLLRDNCQLIGMSLIVLARQAQKIAINLITWIYSADIVPAQVKGNINICAEDSVLGKNDCLFFPESKKHLIKIVEIVYPPYLN